MKKEVKKLSLFLVILLVVFFPNGVSAKRGCCSWHGGVAGCNEDGRQICKDGTLSPSCTCTPTKKTVYGCTDKTAKNYNSKATKNDGSCKYYVYGCTGKEAKNYNSLADKDNGTCEYYVYGCTDKEAKNYNKDAEKDDNSCEYYKYGCTDKKAINYDSNAEKDDGTCDYPKEAEETGVSNSSSDNPGSILPVLTIGGTAGGIYYYKKKKKA